MEKNLKAKITALPDEPGVYLFKDSGGRVIYVGKANSLKKRVRSYFLSGLSVKTAALVSNIADIEYRPCPTESMALLLEASLARQYKPKYNIALRDDKSFPLVKITNEEFPAIYVTRKREADGAEYIGPFTNAKLLKSALKIIRRNFAYRSCKILPKKACVYYRLGLSPAPCVGKISKNEYTKTINNIRLVLEGRTGELIKKLSQDMCLKSKELKFEEAANIRDQISALSAIGESRAVSGVSGQLQGLKSLLGLKRLPVRIEAFDISNIYGKEATGSMISFYKGFSDKDNYRRFRVKSVSGIDDYAMLREVVFRRYLRLKEENLPMPDMILIDGGKAHLRAVAGEINKLGLNIPLASIAKEKENIYTPAQANAIHLKQDTPALNLIRRIRDEAHRFAVSYHRVLRRKKIIGK